MPVKRECGVVAAIDGEVVVAFVGDSVVLVVGGGAVVSGSDVGSAEVVLVSGASEVPVDGVEVDVAVGVIVVLSFCAAVVVAGDAVVGASVVVEGVEVVVVGVDVVVVAAAMVIELPMHV